MPCNAASLLDTSWAAGIANGSASPASSRFTKTPPPPALTLVGPHVVARRREQNRPRISPPEDS
eukprot:2647342-Pleurochrysis_carterae.AAC.1